MSAINHFNLRSFDLNLLIAFDVLMQERSVTLAAAKLRLQQPAMSHNLSTLRMLLDDELFIRVKQTLQPTTKALALAGPIRQVLEQAQDALLMRDGFDAAREERTFRIGLTNGLEVLLLPELLRQFRHIAPGVRLLARSVDAKDARQMLDRGEIDIGVGCFDKIDGWHRQEYLFEETVTCCYNPRLLQLETPLTEATYVRVPHAVVSFRDSLGGCLEEALNKINAELNVVAAAPNFLAVLSMVAQSPIVTTLPTRIALHYAPMFDLKAVAAPLPFGANPITLVWHALSERDSGCQWLRNKVRESGFASREMETIPGDYVKQLVASL
ncbi:MAG: LysR family transcriptional regulator [Pseudomonadota bacterium]